MLVLCAGVYAGGVGWNVVVLDIRLCHDMCSVLDRVCHECTPRTHVHNNILPTAHTHTPNTPSASPPSPHPNPTHTHPPLLHTQVAYIQAALLYTASCGERRIRVATTMVPIVQELSELYRATDGAAQAALMARLAVEKSLGVRGGG